MIAFKLQRYIIIGLPKLASLLFY